MENINYCNCCAVKYEAMDAFCNACGFPLQGTKQEQDFYISERNVKEIELIDLDEKVERARRSLYWISGLTLFSLVFVVFKPSPDEDVSFLVITTLILSTAFLGLAVWGKTRTSTALISGLSLYLIIHILNAILDPRTILSGIIVKVVIIVYLVKGIKSVIEREKIKKELNLI
ncbi:hypothetical protein DBR43_22385 [Pedobacter sp. KBW06]|uniref:hypothetical protein n=1 Tax=Pedobacter sp. KBW06 TaxID=2153359 RepID=UPI000F5B4517|nr:hypothetical protein [Pedobacter sp. KBW06]RQO70745.1 hypothetical protein DBR43_22385 [Pedobacter sp. KBW06]